MFTGKEGSAITTTEASDMTEAYRDANPGALKGHFIGKDILNDILAQSGCMGIRIYYGLEEGNKKLVLVGADSSENDQMTGIIADRFEDCPSKCGVSNDLNS